MSAGSVVAGAVLTILAMACFQEGGLFIIEGIICLLAVIGIIIANFLQEN